MLPVKLVPESVAAVTGAHSYKDVLPLMLARYCGPSLLDLADYRIDCRCLSRPWLGT